MFESPAFRDAWAPRLLSIVRILLGLLYLQHGLSKYFGFSCGCTAEFSGLFLAWARRGDRDRRRLNVGTGDLHPVGSLHHVGRDGGRVFHREKSFVDKSLPDGKRRSARGRLQHLLLRVLPGRWRRMEPRPVT